MLRLGVGALTIVAAVASATATTAAFLDVAPQDRYESHQHGGQEEYALYVHIREKFGTGM